MAEKSSSLGWYFLARKGEHISLHWLIYRTVQKEGQILIFMSELLISCLFFYS